MSLHRTGSLAALILLPSLAFLTGCSLMGAGIAQLHESHEERETRRPVAMARAVPPGARLVVRLRDSATTVRGEFLGFTPGSDSLALQVGWQEQRFAAADVEWIADARSPHNVLYGFVPGLAIDIGVLIYLGSVFEGFSY